MKKLAFALALFLPLLFTSCGDDDNNTMKFEVPVTSWGSTQAQVKAKVNSEKYLLDTVNSDSETLIYDTVNTIYANGLPWVIYMFDNNELEASAITVPYPQADDDFYAFLKKNYTLYEVDDEDGTCYMGNNKDITKATIWVMYYLLDDEDYAQALWMEADNTRSAADMKAVAAKAKAIATQKVNM